MTIKSKLKKAGLITLASLVGVMPLKAQENIENIGYTFYSHAALNQPEGKLSFDYNGKRYVLTDTDRNDKPDVLETDENQFTGDVVEQKYGRIYRERRNALIQEYVHRFKSALRNKEGKVKIEKTQFLLDKFPTIEVKLKGDDGRTYSAIDCKDNKGTESFYVSAKGKKDKYVLFINNDNSLSTQKLIGDLVDFAVRNNMPEL